MVMAAGQRIDRVRGSFTNQPVRGQRADEMLRSISEGCSVEQGPGVHEPGLCRIDRGSWADGHRGVGSRQASSGCSYGRWSGLAGGIERHGGRRVWGRRSIRGRIYVAVPDGSRARGTGRRGDTGGGPCRRHRSCPTISTSISIRSKLTFWHPCIEMARPRHDISFPAASPRTRRPCSSMLFCSTAGHDLRRSSRRCTAPSSRSKRL